MGAWRYSTDCATGHREWSWHPRVAAPERSLWWPCVKAGALALPLAIGPSVFFPAAAPPAAIAAPLPPLPPLPSPGSAGQGFYVPPYLPPREGSEFSPYVPAGETSPISTGFSPSPALNPQTPPSSRDFAENSPPRTAVPEPAASLALLAVGASGAVLVRRRRG